MLRVLERAASKAADLTAFDHVGLALLEVAHVSAALFVAEVGWRHS